MLHRLLFVTIVCLGSAGVRAEPLSCLIQPYQEADIGTQVVGVIDHVLVERGDFVKKGQPVVQLNSDVERAALAAAKLRAEATADLRAAASNHEFAQKKKVRTDDLYQKNFVSQQATDQASTEAQVAEMKLRQVREQQRLAQQELALAQAQLAQRTIRSPLNGVVVEKYLSEGERVEEKAVVKVATIDPLKVEVIVPASYFSKIKQGMGANVKPEMAEAEAAGRQGGGGGQGDRCGQQQLPGSPRAAQSELPAAARPALQSRLRPELAHGRERTAEAGDAPFG